MVESARRATSDDLSRIVELARLLRAELAPMKGGELWLQRDAWPEPLSDAYSGLLERVDVSVIVGAIDDVIVGYGVVVIEMLRSSAHLGVITDLFVEPDARSVGVGECIADALLAVCAERDCIGIDALALPGHRDTKNFFERNGFTARALTMHRDLRS